MLQNNHVCKEFSCMNMAAEELVMFEDSAGA